MVHDITETGHPTSILKQQKRMSIPVIISSFPVQKHHNKSLKIEALKLLTTQKQHEKD